MAKARTLTVNLVGDSKSVEKAFKRVSKGSDLMSDRIGRATRGIRIGFGLLGGAAIGAVAAVKPMIDLAADLEESVSKNRLMFGEASAAVEKFAETAITSFGVSRSEALEATGTFGNLGKAMNMSEQDAADMAIQLTSLAGDLSSLHNVRVEEALTALRAGLIGEAAPLRRLGRLLDAATIKAKALELGLVKNTKEALTPAMKSQAAYALILDKGSIAMGDFERTSASAVNQQKILKDQMERAATSVGEAFLPAFTAIVTALNEKVMPAVREFFENPSWYEFGRLAGKAAGSGFGTSLSDIFAGLERDEIDDLGFWESWKASAELNFAASAVSAAWRFINGAKEVLDENDPFDDFRYGEGIAGIGHGSGSQNKHLAGAFDFLLPAGGDSSGTPPGRTIPGGGLGDPRLGVPAPDYWAGLDRRLGESAEVGGGVRGGHAQGGLTPQERSGWFSEFTGLTADMALKLLSDPDADLSRFADKGYGGGPPNTQINVNVSGVSGNEVVEALGLWSQDNGPLPASLVGTV